MPCSFDSVSLWRSSSWSSTLLTKNSASILPKRKCFSVYKQDNKSAQKCLSLWQNFAVSISVEENTLLCVVLENGGCTAWSISAIITYTCVWENIDEKVSLKRYHLSFQVQRLSKLVNVPAYCSRWSFCRTTDSKRRENKTE